MFILHKPASQIIPGLYLPVETITAGGTNTSNTVTVTWNLPGPRSVRVNYTDINGCTATTATVKNISVHASPVPLINGPDASCTSLSCDTYSTAAGMTGYTWTVFFRRYHYQRYRNQYCMYYLANIRSSYDYPQLYGYLWLYCSECQQLCRLL